MPSMIYALVDCNNFFVSCERVFNPQLHDRPVVVLSNNDGCAISRSNEAKKLGIAMGEPFFKFRNLIKSHNLAVLSSNFALYGDLSARVMSVIEQSTPESEVYSIDETFINLSSLPASIDLHTYCSALVTKIEKYTGLPVSIGIASSKTLAKVANHIAKQNNIPERVFYLDDTNKRSILVDLKVRDVWGIGRRCEKKLHALGVYTAAQLATLPETTVKKVFNVVMWRTVQELNGISCINLRDVDTDKKNIMVSRSFGYRVTNIIELQQALATYVSMAAEKLRAQNSITGGLYVFLQTGRHGDKDTLYRNSTYITLANRTADTRMLIAHAKQGLEQLFKEDYRYQKVGVILCDLVPATSKQFDIFADEDIEQRENLMQTIDQINKKLGKATLQFGATSLDKPWRLKSDRKSNNYIGNWNELPIVKLC